MIQRITVLILFSSFSIFTMAQERISKSFSGIESISINTSSSDCILKKGSSPDVKVDLEHNYSKSFEPVIDKEGSRLVIKELFEKGSTRGQGKWTLTVPDNMDVRFNTGSGNLEAADLDFELDMNTGSGDIELEKVRADLKFNTGSGDIFLTEVEGVYAANTGSGSFQLDNANGDFRLNTGSGDIRLKNVNAVVSANTGSGDVRASGLTLAGKCTFNTGSGNATIQLQATPKFDISVNSGSGDSQIDFAGNTIAGLIVMKANKKNGRIEAPFEFDKVEEEKSGSQTIIKKTSQIGNSDAKIKISTGSGSASISK